MIYTPHSFNQKTLGKTLLILLILCITTAVHGQQHSVLIYIRDDVYIDYQKFVANRDVSSIDNFSGKNIRRDVVDMIIAQQALKLGGFNRRFSYAPGKVNFQWFDFILMPFNSTPDQSFTMSKIHLVPVKNIGVVLKDS
ncbi:hypothetical protein [Colwellia piezophila]|uniref:hypothetical protein n=1 Tax=Colwellia piezophila TaxID=211668 RepID=UPI000370D7B3|nr:hypothetical protein [Colwellia piezophila]